MKLSVLVDGDLAVTIKDRVVKTRVIIVRTDEAQAEQYQVLGIEPVDPIVEGSIAVKSGFAVLPFEGNGRYTIPAGSPHDVQQKAAEAAQPAGPGNQSGIRVEWWQSDGETFEYLRRGEPCTVEVEKGGMKGTLRCPRITQEVGGKHFSLELRWEEP